MRERKREMAADLHQLDYTEEEREDYIDIEVSSTYNLLCYTKSTPVQHANEFEFQMFSNSSKRETSSPADELFYKGKLLPLHLPPRLQMFEKLLQNSSPYTHNTQIIEDEHYNTPLTTTAYTTPTEGTPFESCNISPSETPHASRELNQNKYFSEYSADAASFMNENPKKSWAKKLKLGSKLKASQAYLKSFFNKSSSSDQSSHSSYSFESSSLSSGNLTGLSDSSYLMRCGSGRSDVESSIQGAIAHCKRSQQDFQLRKSVSELGFYTLSSSSVIGYEVQDRPDKANPK